MVGVGEPVAALWTVVEVGVDFGAAFGARGGVVVEVGVGIVVVGVNRHFGGAGFGRGFWSRIVGALPACCRRAARVLPAC